MKLIGKYGIVGILAGLCLLFGILNPVFISIGNIMNILNQASILGIIAFGMTLVVLIGGIDLSVGSIVALSGIVLASCLYAKIPTPISIAICIILGGLIGLLNGSLVAFGKVAPFVATLGMMSAVRGLALFISDGRAISNFSSDFGFISKFTILSIPLPIILFLALFMLFYFIQNYTYWGKYILAIGGNERVAWLSGVSVSKYKQIVYSLCGITASIGSIILVSKLNSAQPQAGQMYELDAIAAVVIGGASLSGGKGSIVGTLAGALIIGILQNGLSILNVPVFYQQILIGLIIIFAVLFDNYSRKLLKSEKK